MIPAVYDHMVTQINRYRSWIKAEKSQADGQFVSVKDGVLCTIQSPYLLLSACRAQNGYPLGQKWKVPMFELDNAIKVLRSQQRAFAYRYKQNALTHHDIEAIITHATHHVIRLELDDEDD